MFLFLMGRPWPAPQDFTLPMPASGETIELSGVLPPPTLCKGLCAPCLGPQCSELAFRSLKNTYNPLFIATRIALFSNPALLPSPFLLSLHLFLSSAPPPRASCPSFSPGCKHRLPVAHISHFPIPKQLGHSSPSASRRQDGTGLVLVDRQLNRIPRPHFPQA